MNYKVLEKKFLQEYRNKIFEEFKKAYEINDKFDNFDKHRDLFNEWIMLKRKAASHYVQLFDYMKKDDDLSTNIIAEFNKGALDTIAMEMEKSTEHQPIVISRYAATIPKDSGIIAYSGELLAIDDDVIVSYHNDEDEKYLPNCHPLINDDIDTFMTQTPYNYNSIYPFTKLLNSKKTIFIGTYGALSDKNREENLQKIKTLYNELSNVGYRDINYCSETQDKSYLSAIKISSKQKVLKNTLY